MEESGMEIRLTFQQPAAVYKTQADSLADPPTLQTWKLFVDALAFAGVLRGGNKVDALNGVVLSVRDGQRQNGSIADTTELLGGCVIIDVSSLEDALNWAERSPSSLVGSTGMWPVVVANQVLA